MPVVLGIPGNPRVVAVGEEALRMLLVAEASDARVVDSVTVPMVADSVTAVADSVTAVADSVTVVAAVASVTVIASATGAIAGFGGGGFGDCSARDKPKESSRWRE